MTKLERSWKNCLRMWKWIAEVWKTVGYEFTDIDDLKGIWLEKNRFTKDLTNECFFCDFTGYASFSRNSHKCNNCPGHQVSGSFNCMNDAYHWDDKPKAFYKKLCQLAKKGGYERFI